MKRAAAKTACISYRVVSQIEAAVIADSDLGTSQVIVKGHGPTFPRLQKSAAGGNDEAHK
jgi:hypothetical protein